MAIAIAKPRPEPIPILVQVAFLQHLSATMRSAFTSGKKISNWGKELGNRINRLYALRSKPIRDHE